MIRTKQLTLVPALALLATAPALAQEGGGATQEAKPQAQTQHTSTFIKAPLGAKAIVENDEGQRLGVIRDHVIDARTGKVQHVVVGAGEGPQAAAHLVPYERFSWNAEEEQLVLALSAQELAALPKYEKMKPTPDGEGAEAREASAKPDPGRLTATEIAGSAIMARQDPFSQVGELVLEPERGVIVFVLAGRGAGEQNPYVIPWRAMTWTAAEEEGEQGAFMIGLAKDELQGAPKLEKGDVEKLKEPGTVERIYSFYKLTPPHEKGKRG